MKGVEIFIRGTVQGVGFRPFIYNLARRFDLSGSVANTGEGVIIRALFKENEREEFIRAVQQEAPPLSRIHSIDSQDYEGKILEGSFSIAKSSGTSSASASIPPDITICADCTAELQDPNDPRYAYPFINCTNCGPRFTIVEKIPYDRPYTSMKVFPMCARCTEDYEDPGNRRFHAQPNACPLCGPQVSWHNNDGTKLKSSSPLASAATALGESKIVAIRGLGGFHLACDAHSAEAISKLRIRKTRPHKPLAIMVESIEVAKQYCFINDTEKQLLESLEHPIVLLKKKDNVLPENLAPGIVEIGLMLAYTPLHFLLFQQQNCPNALVMTSGNSSGTPICTANDEAIERLGHLVDNFLLHNREIVTRIDDSVTRVTGGKPLILRRARGYVPSPIINKISKDKSLPPTIGCGAGLKSTFCLAKNGNLYTSQHIGDLANIESYDFYVESIEHLEKVFQITPEIAVCDLHPDYMSTHYGKELGIPLYQVQHHHAHAVAVMAEHNLQEELLAIVLDGTGYGDDGTIWGGEIFELNLREYTRRGHLSHMRLPGGDAASKEPWRVALSLLHDLSQKYPDLQIPDPVIWGEESKRQIIKTMLASDFNCPKTSSCGRLFDAVSSLLGICHIMSYEGQAAMELEDFAKRALSSHWKKDLYSIPFDQSTFLLDGDSGTWEINSLELIKIVIEKLQAGIASPEISRDFHYLLIRSLHALTKKLIGETGLRKIVLSGGCMQNSIILEGLTHCLTLDDIEVFTGENIPLNDGGISLGQTIIGGLQHVYSNANESHEG